MTVTASDGNRDRTFPGGRTVQGQFTGFQDHPIGMAIHSDRKFMAGFASQSGCDFKFPLDRYLSYADFNEDGVSDLLGGLHMSVDSSRVTAPPGMGLQDGQDTSRFAPDLALTKTHSGSFIRSTNNNYTLTVRNVGMASTTGTITVTDTLPVGLSFVSATGLGWTCSHSNGTVSCTNSGSLRVLSAAEYVDALYGHAGITPSAAERQAAVAEFSTPAGARGRVLRRVAENATLFTREFNRAFVLAQYFGYLRRNPDDEPDNNLDGYNFWLNKLNQFNDYRDAEMVKSFITSGEYRHRFGP